MNNAQISDRIKRIADLMELLEVEPFKIRSFRRAVRIIHDHPEEMGILIDEDRLKELPGIGKSLAREILYLAKSGGSKLEKELTGTLPEGLVELLDLPGLGRAKVKQLWQDHGVTQLDQLEMACRSGELSSWKGFGPVLESKLLKAIEFKARNERQFLLDTALEMANSWIESLSSIQAIERIELSGKLRRRNELIQSIDLLLAGDPKVILQELTDQYEVEDQSSDHVLIADPSGMPINLWIMTMAQLPSQQLIKTGGQAFMEYLASNGYHPDSLEVAGNLPAAVSESELVKSLGLVWIEPELRDAYSRPPGNDRLIDQGDILGTFHAHSTWSDGANTLEDLVQGCIGRGYQYFGISEHSKAAYYANGLGEDRVRAQWDRIDELNEKYPEIHIFKGIEADILKTGELDYDEDLLSGFDFVIASIHSHFHLDPVTQTDRLIRALQSPFTTMLGHPTGRMLLAREGYDPDMSAVVQAAAQYKKIIEINTTPKRLDLDWRHLDLARTLGVKVSINPDAHRVSALDSIPLGVMMARKGGLSPSDVINTLDLKAMKIFLQGDQ